MGLHCIDEAKIGIARLQKTNSTKELTIFANIKILTTQLTKPIQK